MANFMPALSYCWCRIYVSSGATHTCGIQAIGIGAKSGPLVCWGSLTTSLAGNWVSVSSAVGTSCALSVTGVVQW